MLLNAFHRATLACALSSGLLFCLAACGGGSADSTPAAPPPPQAQPAAADAAAAWTPSVTDTWQWQLRGTIDTSYDVAVYDVDLVDAPQATIDSLKAAGRRVVCYFSAGTSEDWRPDFASFLPADMGNALPDWPGERWLDTRSDNVRAIMRARLDLAVSKGCDGVEPDNVDGYTNDPGFPLDAATQIDFNRFIAAEAHARALAVGLKNDMDQLGDLVGDFEFAVNEQCHEKSECAGYAVFTSAGKPVFNAEYLATYVNDAQAREAMCADARASNLRTLVLPLQLDGTLRYSCEP